jgi:proline racemase
MAEKWSYVRQHLDHLRRALMLEPRGHRDMFGSILTPPAREDADWGIIFMDGAGYLTMCGHGTIGAATAIVNLGLIEVQEPETIVRFDTPAGLVTAHVTVEQGQAQRVWFENVPAFLFAQGLPVDLPGIGMVTVDIAFGGNFFALVSAQELGVSVEPVESQRIVDLGLRIREAVNAQFKVRHPLQPHINRVELTEITAPATHPEATFKNVVVFGSGQIDRSPCGTGTCARMADLHARGLLKLGESFVHESIVGTLFHGELLAETQVGEFRAVVPRIAGSAYITGLNLWTIDPHDPMKYGFSI